MAHGTAGDLSIGRDAGSTTRIGPIRRHPLLTYCISAFAISWLGVLLVAGGPAGFPADAEQRRTLLPAVVVAQAAGPIVAALLVSMIVGGRAGLRGLLTRFLRWRTTLGPSAVALLTAPLVVMIVVLLFSLVVDGALPAIFTDVAVVPIVLSGVAAGLVAGLLEEPGWTGVALPRLRDRHGILSSGLILGLIWGAWHLSVALWGSGTSTGAFDPVVFASQLAFYFGVLPAYRILMTWVYARGESLLVAMIMHGMLTATTTFILTPAAVTAAQLAAFHLVLAAAVWAVAAAVLFATSAIAGHRKQE